MFIMGMGKEQKRSPDRKETKRSPDKSVININSAVNVTFDEYKGVTVQSRQRISKWDSVEIYIGNIPVDVDLLSFFFFIDKQAEGNCSRIRYRILDDNRFFAHATIAGKSKKHWGGFAVETARRIHGQEVMGISRKDSRTLVSYVAESCGPAVKSQAVVLG